MFNKIKGCRTKPFAFCYRTYYNLYNEDERKETYIMGRKELILKVVGFSLSGVLGVAQIIVDLKRKNKISEADKEDIANRVVAKLKPVKLPKTKVSEN